MTRGNAEQTKIHYKGEHDHYVIFVEGPEAVENWKKDKSIPLAQVVNGWKIFCTHKQGTQGILDGASNAMLESEFGTHKEEEVVKIILEKGYMQETENTERVGNRNLTQGSMISHQP